MRKTRERSRQWRIDNPERSKKLGFEKRLRNKYGITGEEYKKMFETQQGLCKLCQRPETTRVRKGTEQRLAVDHCHKTGTIRGLLCFKCNTALSLIESNPGIINAITSYLS